jgi:Fur family iron response transcriptional regulator
MESANLSPEAKQRLSAMLSAVGLRITAPRLHLAHLLFSNGNRHVTAEKLAAEARLSGVTISSATVYNTLNQFEAAGLLRHVQVDQTRSYFDTNSAPHHHFYIEDEARLIDIAAEEVNLARLPDSPQGYQLDRVEVIIRLDKADKTQ